MLILARGLDIDLSKTSPKPPRTGSRILPGSATCYTGAMTAADNPLNARFYCGPLTIDLNLGTVQKGADDLVRFSPVELKVLTQLIRHQGELLGRALLFDAVWPNQQVNDEVLTRAISDIRTSLARLDDQKYIETLPRRGYRWAVPLVLASEGMLVAPMTPATLKTDSPVIYTSFLTTRLPRPTLAVRVLGFVFCAWLLASSIMWTLGYIFLPAKYSLAVLPATTGSSSAAPMANLLDENLRAQLRHNQRITLLSKTAIASRPANPFPYFFNEFGARWVLEARVNDYEGSNNVELTLVDARTGIELRSLHFAAATSTELAVQLARKLEPDLLQRLVP